MNFDQYEEPRPEQVELARGVAVLLSVLIDESGAPRDLADKKGREALIRAISDIPREIPARLSESDRELLKEFMDAQKKQQQMLIEQYKENQKLIKSWFKYIIWGCVIVAGLFAAAFSLLIR
jgi:hypothetical protein